MTRTGRRQAPRDRSCPRLERPPPKALPDDPAPGGPKGRIVLRCTACGRRFPVPDPARFRWQCPCCGMFMRELECSRCGHVWSPRGYGSLPRICPACKSPYWDRAKRHEYIGGGLL